LAPSSRELAEEAGTNKTSAQRFLLIEKHGLSEAELAIEAAIIESNRQRVKTNAILAREAKELKRIESELAKRRQAQAEGKPRGEKSVMAQVSGQTTRRAVADKLGVGEKTADRLADIGEAIEEAEVSNDTARVEELEAAVNFGMFYHDHVKLNRSWGIVERHFCMYHCPHSKC